MKYLVSTSDIPCYIWEILVQINNFRKYGLEENLIYVISSNNISFQLNEIINDNSIKCKFYIYKDTRKYKYYMSSIRPHILEKFYKEHDYISKETVLYLDPDVIFTTKPDLEHLCNDDKWYSSDTSSYMGIDYINSKGYELLPNMCRIIGIDTKTVIDNNSNCGGAQILMKNVTSEFWKKCYIDCEKLYVYLKENLEELPNNNTINIWCTDMWVVLWNTLLFGHTNIVHKDLDFSWNKDDISKWNTNYIFHNAGVTSKDEDIYFKKRDFSKTFPFNKNITISHKYCGYNYLKEIKETEKTFKQLLIKINL